MNCVGLAAPTYAELSSASHVHRSPSFKHSIASDPEREAFKAVLAQHGFQAAAKEFSERIDFHQAAETWNDYPACMARYPARCKTPRKV